MDSIADRLSRRWGRRRRRRQCAVVPHCRQRLAGALRSAARASSWRCSWRSRRRLLWRWRCNCSRSTSCCCCSGSASQGVPLPPGHRHLPQPAAGAAALAGAQRGGLGGDADLRRHQRRLVQLPRPRAPVLPAAGRHHALRPVRPPLRPAQRHHAACLLRLQRLPAAADQLGQHELCFCRCYCSCGAAASGAARLYGAVAATVHAGAAAAEGGEAPPVSRQRSAAAAADGCGIEGARREQCCCCWRRRRWLLVRICIADGGHLPDHAVPEHRQADRPGHRIVSGHCARGSRGVLHGQGGARAAGGHGGNYLPRAQRLLPQPGWCVSCVAAAVGGGNCMLTRCA